jgi:hypothetical protein
MGRKSARADGFYKFLALVGLTTAISATGLSTWNIQRTQERAFTLETDVATLTTEVARQQAEVGHIQEYLDTMTAKVRTAVDVGTPHYNFMVDEVENATKRVERGQLLLKGATGVATLKSSQIATLNAQRGRTVQLGWIATGTGLVLTLCGLALWFWRVQRFVEIETQTRMTTNMVEALVAQTRIGAARARESTPGMATATVEEKAVVSSRTSPQGALPTA